LYTLQHTLRLNAKYKLQMDFFIPIYVPLKPSCELYAYRWRVIDYNCYFENIRIRSSDRRSFRLPICMRIARPRVSAARARRCGICTHFYYIWNRRHFHSSATIYNVLSVDFGCYCYKTYYYVHFYIHAVWPCRP